MNGRFMNARRAGWLLFAFAALTYVILFLDGWWSQGKGVYAPLSTRDAGQQRLSCSSDEIRQFSVHRENPDYRRDARWWLLEFHRSEIFYADLLSRPDCVGQLLTY